MSRAKLSNYSKSKTSGKVRNGKIDFYKLIFAFVVMFYHYSCSSKYDNEFFTKGYIAVEFFFIVSGFLYAKSLSKYDNSNKSELKDSAAFIINKYKAFFPYHIFAVVITLIYSFFYFDWGFGALVENIINDIPNLFLFQMIGIGSMKFVMHEWYISAILVVMFILTPIIMKDHERFTHYIAPIIAALSLGFLKNNFTSLNLVSDWTGFAYAGIIRAFGEICLGCFCYVVYESGILNRFNKIILLLVEWGSFLFTLLYAFDRISLNMDFIVVFVIALGVTIAFCDKCSLSIFNNRIVYFLGKWSFAIYMNHNYIRFIMIDLKLDMSYYEQQIIYLICVIISSLCCMLVMDYILPRIFKKLNKRKKSRR